MGLCTRTKVWSPSGNTLPSRAEPPRVYTGHDVHVQAGAPSTAKAQCGGINASLERSIATSSGRAWLSRRCESTPSHAPL